MGQLISVENLSFIVGAASLAAPVTLVAGSNVTLTPSGNQLTISASGGGGVLYPLLAPNGTAGAPSYSFGSDHGMGMFTDGSSLELATGGVTLATFGGGQWQMVGANSFFILGSAASSSDPVGTSVQPSLVFANNSASGWYSPQNGTWTFGQSGTDLVQIDGGAFSVPVNNIQIGPADQTTGSLISTDGTSLLFHDNTAGNDTFKLDGNATANETSMLLWDITAASLRRVSIGAADSGGTGFRVLRIPN